MSRSFLHVPLDVSYYEDPKVIDAGERAELLYIRCLCLSKRTLQDGFVADAQLRRMGVSRVQERARKLADVGLFRRDDERGGWWIVAFLKHNPSAADVEELREKRRQAGRLGGKAPRSTDDAREQTAKQSAEQRAELVANPEAEASAWAPVEAKAEARVVPRCPRCHGAMHDNRADKAGPNSPDYRCKNPECIDPATGRRTAIWPETANSERPQPSPEPLTQVVNLARHRAHIDEVALVVDELERLSQDPAVIEAGVKEWRKTREQMGIAS